MTGEGEERFYPRVIYTFFIITFLRAVQLVLFYKQIGMYIHSIIMSIKVFMRKPSPSRRPAHPNPLPSRRSYGMELLMTMARFDDMAQQGPGVNNAHQGQTFKVGSTL